MEGWVETWRGRDMEGSRHGGVGTWRGRDMEGPGHGGVSTFVQEVAADLLQACLGGPVEGRHLPHPAWSQQWVGEGGEGRSKL